MKSIPNDPRREQIIDGNRAAAEVAYHFSEVAALYPITPSSPMGEAVESFASRGRKNYAGETVRAISMQSEGGAAGLLHGALSAGTLATTFTSSQGLLLMLPTLFKLAGEGLPGVIYVAARAVATHALSIFGDHSDVYATRSAGTALFCLSSVQEVADLAPVAHLAALRGRLPVMVFFDGFRTSHEVCKVQTWTPEALNALLDREALADFRRVALNPTHPVMRGTAENSDLYFQHREAANGKYNSFADRVEEAMMEANAVIGSEYQLFQYYGAPDAERVIVAMGSVSGTIRETLEGALAHEKVGFLQVRLYHPFDKKRFIAALPKSCRVMAVLDRAKEPGAVGEPLYLEVSAALAEEGWQGMVVSGRYGLASKDTTPGDILAVYKHLQEATPTSPFTLGICDDVTGLSLERLAEPQNEDFVLRAYGVGGDGTVSALKNMTRILGEDYHVQAYFQYDSKKTGSITTGHLRLSKSPILGSYLPPLADVILCANLGLLRSDFPITDRIKEGGSLLIATDLSMAELMDALPDFAKGRLAKRRVKVYLLPTTEIAKNSGIGKRKGSLLLAGFFAAEIGYASSDIAEKQRQGGGGLLTRERAMEGLVREAKRAYASKGEQAVEATVSAIAAIFDAPPMQMEIPDQWNGCPQEAPPEPFSQDSVASLPDGWDTERYLRSLLRPVSRMRGDEVPVSALMPYVEGSLPTGTAAFEKRSVSDRVSSWHPERCIQCGRCSFVCPHAAIRAALISEEEQAGAPQTIPTTQRPGGEGLLYTISVSPADCTGCTLCTRICPVSALSMEGRAEEAPKQEIFDYIYRKVSEKAPPAKWDSVRGVQFSRPLQEFSGACAGCAQAAYARLVTQLFGRRMVISNATGCSSIWGGSAPTSPYAVHPEGGGPAWANSLFEDNAEHGLGIAEGMAAMRARQIERVRTLQTLLSAPRTSHEVACEPTLGEAIDGYLSTICDGRTNALAARRLIEELEGTMNRTAVLSKLPSQCAQVMKEILADRAQLEKPSIWLFGGDGWAYDIGFGGLFHVLAGGSDVNVLVFDTEVYSNTGGQASGASRVGQVARFAEGGKRTGKKNLAELAMTLGNVYVAQIAMGADQNQTLRALIEAEAYPGPSLVIAYSPCELHGVVGGLCEGQAQMERAVKAGYLTLFRFHPTEGRFTVDSREPDPGALREFLRSENRYARLERERPEVAEKLFASAEASAREGRDRLLAMGSALAGH